MIVRLTENIYLVGSGNIRLSHPTDPNIYLIDGKGTLALVDAGSGICPELIIHNIHQSGFKPEDVRFIINTHSHWDHARGSAYLKELTGAKLLIHEMGVDVVESKLWPDGYLAKKGIGARSTKVDKALADKEALQVGNLQLVFYHTPGHSNDSICILMESEGKKMLFSGDTVFAEGLPGTVNADTDFVKYRNSMLRLADLECDVLLPGHKLFVLANASEHIQLLKEKLTGRWRDVVMGPTPFFPGWWLEHRPSLYEDAL